VDKLNRTGLYVETPTNIAMKRISDRTIFSLFYRAYGIVNGFPLQYEDSSLSNILLQLEYHRVLKVPFGYCNPRTAMRVAECLEQTSLAKLCGVSRLS
jgi:hypothetical protein